MHLHGNDRNTNQEEIQQRLGFSIKNTTLPLGQLWNSDSFNTILHVLKRLDDLHLLGPQGMW